MARKLSMPKGSPSIDMTPMVDLAFLLVTFFMLAAKTRSSEPVDVNYSTSISDEEVPTKTLVMMTIDSGGCVYLNPGPGGPEGIRKDLLMAIGNDYGIKFTADEIEEFEKITSFGCSVSELPKYLSLTDAERKSLQTKGVPSDTIVFKKNELKDWLYYSNKLLKPYGEKVFKEDLANKKPDQPEPKPEDYRPKFVLRADGAAVYAYAKKVVETCRDLKINNLNFVTKLEIKR